ncbi:MAG: PQQ-binding-like beta-propeller repeat protein, partial [Polyangiaceae bacterium]
MSIAVFSGVVAAVVAFRGAASEQGSPPAGNAGTKAELGATSSVLAAKSAQAPPNEIREDFRPLLADVDGDGTADVVAAIDTTDAARTQHYAAFSGRDGHELARTPSIADRNGALTAVVGRRLVSASRAGQLTSYGLANGSQQWTTALGARATAFCNAKNGESLIVATDESRRLAIDLTTGRQSETKEPCNLLLTRADRNDDPRDRHDYDAPQGTESYHCGGVTVMGSQNYTVQDQCLARARIDTDRLDGFVGHRLWKMEQNWLAFGVRKPGARVPMLALVSR